jgi:hypothetical protein
VDHPVVFFATCALALAVLLGFSLPGITRTFHQAQMVTAETVLHR